MNEKINASKVRQFNKRRIFRTLVSHGPVTKQELATETQLSIPKITQVLQELSQDGLVEECGMLSSSGGRRPTAFCASVNERLSAGIDVSRNHLCFSVVNLKGEVLVTERIRLSMELNEGFYETLYARFMQFLGEHSIRYDRLVGLGISLAGIISSDQNYLAYSHVFRITEPFDLRPLQERLRVPVAFYNDANAACMAECYTGLVPTSFNFLSLSNTVGGAVVIDHQIISGSSGRTGEAGHMMIIPGGRKCYCGKQGHYDPYGSALLLAEPAGGSLADFFAGLAEQNEQYQQIFEEYLSHLALMICNLHLWSDLPIVIGGYAASFLTPYIQTLKEKIAALNIFTEEQEYLYLSNYQFEAASVGCARCYIEQFLDNL